MKKEELIKPVPFPRDPILDYHEMMRYIEKKYKFDSRDYAKSHGHFGKWCDKKGYGKTDPDGKHRNSSQIWFAEYRIDPAGEVTCPPYLDFWHHVISGNDNIYNGTEMYIDLDPLDPECAEDYPTYPDWAKEILQLVKNEFGQYSKNNGLTVWIEW